jgi:hypothetical protein
MTSFALQFQIGRKLAWGARSKGKPCEALKCGSKCKIYRPRMWKIQSSKVVSTNFTSLFSKPIIT